MLYAVNTIQNILEIVWILYVISRIQVSILIVETKIAINLSKNYTIVLYNCSIAVK
jgi:hypothetical protein